MPRIVAGAARGRRLRVAPGVATRPTSDRAREGLFSTLEALRGDLVGIRFLDLYAGSGAVGLEALSRGALHARFVEGDPRAARALQENVVALALPGAEVTVAEVARVVARGPSGPAYHVAFLDPPYAAPVTTVIDVLSALRGREWLAADAVVVVERATRDGDLPWPCGFACVRSRRYGEGTLWYGRAAGLRRPLP